jgi:hypothetical protein
MMNKKMFCPKCNMWVEEPSVNTPGREWVNFHTGRCPKCGAILKSTPSQVGFLRKFFGRTKKRVSSPTRLPNINISTAHPLSSEQQAALFLNVIELTMFAHGLKGLTTTSKLGSTFMAKVSPQVAE